MSAAQQKLEALVAELSQSLRWALEWIDAVPSDTPLPTMPGFDRDYVNELLDAVRYSAPLPAEQPSNPVVLTDKQKANIGHAALILKREGHVQLADSLQGILARIVGQQAKGGGNGN